MSSTFLNLLQMLSQRGLGRPAPAAGYPTLGNPMIVDRWGGDPGPRLTQLPIGGDFSQQDLEDRGYLPPRSNDLLRPSPLTMLNFNPASPEDKYARLRRFTAAMGGAAEPQAEGPTLFEQPLPTIGQAGVTAAMPQSSSPEITAPAPTPHHTSLEEWLAQARGIGSAVVPPPDTSSPFPGVARIEGAHPRLAAVLGSLMNSAAAIDPHGPTAFSLQQELARRAAAQALPGQQMTAGADILKDYGSLSHQETADEIAQDQLDVARQNANRPVTVSPGSAIVDPHTGKIIYESQAREAADPATVQEYKFAQSQGFKGSILDYLNAKRTQSTSLADRTADEWLKANPGKTLVDYAKWRASISPQASAQFRNAPASIQKMVSDSYTQLNDDEQRLQLMEGAAREAATNPQADMQLVANHVGMTLGLQKGTRINQTHWNEAVARRPWLQGLKVKFVDGVLTGALLSPEQREQMVSLAKDRVATSRQRYNETVHDVQEVAPNVIAPGAGGSSNIDLNSVIDRIVNGK